jgi:hypothetical protein
MARETRWPKFAAAAADAGIHSMLGYRLFITGRTFGRTGSLLLETERLRHRLRADR